MKSIQKLGTLCIVFLMICSIFFYTTKAEENTTVSVQQENIVYYPCDQFNISIMCYPTELIKGYEFKVSYDPTIIRAEQVREGNIFSGYPTFFNKGIIDNSTGTIINIYGLILGPGNVSEAGSFVTISFTCLQAISTSINLYAVGVVNGVPVYIPITVINGTLNIGRVYDVNGDDQCNFIDILLVSMHYGETGIPGWIREDINRDGIVDIREFLIVSIHYGESW